jgi:hypothetical protein
MQFQTSMKINIIILIVFLFVATSTFSQHNVGIGTNTPDSNAILEMKSTDKGILIPRMTSTQRNNMTPTLGINQKGLLVFDNDSSKFFYWNGIMWLTFQSGTQGPPGVANIQSYGVTGTGTYVNSIYPLWTSVIGLNNTINLVDSATLNIFTNGRIDAVGTSGGFYVKIQIFMNGNPITNALQTFNSVTNYPNYDIMRWSFSYPLKLPAGTYFFEVKACKNYSSSPDFSASSNNEGSLIIQVFY